MMDRALSMLAGAGIGAILFLAFAIPARLMLNQPPTFHVERIDVDDVACVAVKNGAHVALSCNWPAAAPQWWQPQHEEPTP